VSVCFIGSPDNPGTGWVPERFLERLTRFFGFFFMKTGAQIDHHGLVIGPELRPSSGYDICDLSLETSLEE